MKISARVILGLLVFAVLYLFYAAYKIVVAPNLNLDALITDFLFASLSVSAIFIYYEKFKETHLPENDAAVIKEMLFRTKYLLDVNREIFCSGQIEKKVLQVKTMRKNFLAGRAKEMIVIKEFEGLINKAVESLFEMEEVFFINEKFIQDCEGISDRQRKKFFEIALTHSREYAKIREISLRYFDFKVG